MLGICHDKSVIEELRQAADTLTKLPMLTARYFFEPKSPMPSHFSSRRSFHRYYLRSKAILIQGDRVYGIYTTDVSRRGIGFLSPRQLMPKEKWTLKLPNGVEYQLQVKCCRRECDNCFSCGGCFTM